MLICMISTCFNAYKIVQIGTFPVTLSVLAIAAYIVVGYIGLDYGDYPDKKHITIYLLFILLIALSIISNYKNFDANSTLLYVFFLTAYLFSKYRISDKKFLKIIYITTIVYTVFSLYAIYQFLAYAVDLPFSDFIIPGHMVEGFNRTNMVYIGDIAFMRAHSIYAEPSTLSQFAAITMVFAAILFGYKYIKIYVFIPIVIVNLIAMLMSVAGTGILALGVIALVFLIMCIIKRKYLVLPIIAGIALVVALIFVFISDYTIVVYIRERILEIFNPRMSGGMRFVAPYVVAHWVIVNRIFGYSPGSDGMVTYYYQDHHPGQDYVIARHAIDSGYGKIAVELGLFGVILLVILFLTLRKNSFYKYIFTYMAMLLFIGGNLLHPTFWVYVILLNNDPHEEYIIEKRYQTKGIQNISGLQVMT